MSFIRRMVKLLTKEPEGSRLVKVKKVDKAKLAHIRKEVREQFEKAVGDLESFCSVVETMNANLIDLRLDSESGTMECMAEIRDYNAIFDNFLMPMILGQRDEDGKRKLYFEV